MGDLLDRSRLRNHSKPNVGALQRLGPDARRGRPLQQILRYQTPRTVGQAVLERA